MAEDKPSTWRKVRVAFRRVRIFCLVLLLLFLAAILWLNYVGVPGFVTEKVRAELKRQNFNLEFQKLRLSGFSQFVALNLSFSSTDTNLYPSLFLPRAELLLDKESLHELKFRVRGLRVRGGRAVIPLSTNGTAPPLLVTNIQTELEFSRNDSWQLKEFEAEVLGAKTRASARISNASKLSWGTAKPGAKKTTPWQPPLRDAVDFLKQFEFSGTPGIALEFYGDAAHPEKLNATLRTDWHDLESQWGTIERMRLSCSIHPFTNSITGRFSLNVDGVSSREVNFSILTAEGVSIWNSTMDTLITNSCSILVSNLVTRWTRTEFARAELYSSEQTGTNLLNPENPIQSDLQVYSAPVDLPGARTGTNLLTAHFSHALPFQTPAFFLREILPGPHPGYAESSTLNPAVSGHWSFTTPTLNLERAYAQNLTFSGVLNPTNSALQPRVEFGFWNYLLDYHAPWKLKMGNLYAQNIDIGSLSASGEWLAPEFKVHALDAKLYGGSVEGSGLLNLPTGQLTVQVQSAFDYHKGAQLLDKPVQDWLSQFDWEIPPRVKGIGAVHLPPWNRDWSEGELLKTLTLAGEFEGKGSFRGIDAGAVRSEFGFTNFVWTLPNLTIARPEGAALLAYNGNVLNQDFAVTIESELDPAMLKPIFPSDQQVAFEMIEFKNPPIIKGQASGNWARPEKINFEGMVAATNFAIKGVSYSDLKAQIHYTNLIVEARDFVAHRGKEEVRAPYMRVDIPAERMWVTNAVSNSDPYLAMSLVGDEVYNAIDPYRFATPPTVRINGYVPLRHWSKADIHFEVSGTNFTYWKFHLPSVTGDVYWKADHLSFSNVFASFYQGEGRWSGHFYINDQHSADFSFLADIKNAELKPLMADLVTGTNQMEGILNGQLIITSANSDDMKSWNGYGHGTVNDGYLWNVPIFGVFTPVLNTMIPGVAPSRVSAAEGNFTIRNSVIETKDLQVRAPAFRLNYKGTVDFDGRLDAKVEAEILRDAWLVGRLFSMALWPVSKAFEANISGTLDSPKTKLRYFPRFLLAPLKALAPQNENSGNGKPNDGRKSPDEVGH